jgi:ATP-binding cassette subfamily B multidrug efflux pump
LYSEYGYIEEGRLGKPYNVRLLRRLAHYAFPYKKIIALALFLTILITLLELALPYLSKIAIDQYILSAWYEVRLTRVEEKTVRDFLEKYGSAVERTKDGSHGLIAHTHIKKMDPHLLNRLKEDGVITEKRFYKIPAQKLGQVESVDLRRGAMTMEDGTFAVPLERLGSLKREEILEIRGADLRGVVLISLVIILFLFFNFGLGYGQYYILEFTGQNVMQDIRLELFRRMQSQAVSFFDRHPLGRLVTRVTNDIENLNEMFKSVIITVFKDIFILTGILAILLYMNWRLALVSFILIPFIFGVTLLFSNLAREAFRALRAAVAKMNAFLQERITGMRTIQLFTTEAYQTRTFEKINHENYLAGMKQIRVFALFLPIMELFAAFAVALIIWYGGGSVIRETLSLGSLVAFISYIQMFFKPIRDISEKYNIMQSAMASTERIFEFMDHKEEIPEPVRPEWPANQEGHIQFQGVSFAYQKDQPVLRDVSFEVKPGEMVAVVGPTGAGKTTVVNLLERFYDRDQGMILLDGTDISAYSKPDLRGQIGLVMQDVFIFSGSLVDNVAMGREGMSGEVIERAVREANAHTFIERLPHGLEEEMGEGGSNLSAGERQLLSFARALAYDPKVLILDEATSSVDPETERLIQEAIFKMTEKRTTLVVAHRLSTIRSADRILVMHRGQIREQGTHDELMALGGIYYKLSKFREVEE